MVNNYDWMKEYSFWIHQEIGKHITVNYMMAKDSVKSGLVLMPGKECHSQSSRISWFRVLISSSI